MHVQLWHIDLSSLQTSHAVSPLLFQAVLVNRQMDFCLLAYSLISSSRQQQSNDF